MDARLKAAPEKYKQNVVRLQCAQTSTVAPKCIFEDYGDLLNVEDICEITGLSEQVIRGLCRSGELPAVHIGRRWFVPKSRFAEYVGGVA